MLHAPGQERLTRTKTLGADYTEDAITKRITGYYVLAAPLPARDKNKNDLIIDIPDIMDFDTAILTGIKPDTAKAENSVYTRPCVPAVNLT